MMVPSGKRTRKKSTTSKAVGIPSSERDSISIRPIENGYIVRRSSCDKKGNYMESETYTPTKPDLSIGKAKKK